MTKNEIKLLRAFLIESKMTQVDFAKEVGICERTLRTAIKTGKVSDKTWNKILDAIIAETVQIDLINNRESIKTPNYLYLVLRICYWVIFILAVLMLLNAIF